MVAEPEAVKDNSDTRGWLLGDDKRRKLNVFHTDYKTKLFVEDGELIEERIKSSTKDLSDDELDGKSCRSPPEPPCLTTEEVAENTRSQTIRTGEAALAYYNKKRHTNYEFIDPIMSDGCLWTGGLWFHSNFIAKEGGDDSIPKLFFAELTIPENTSGTKYSVIACRPLDGAKTTTRCEMCGGDRVLHPTRGFRQGLYGFKYRRLRRRDNGRVVKKSSMESEGVGQY
ncbi:hypothetical protein vseg_005596 [Gypsophila vaccaria]